MGPVNEGPPAAGATVSHEAIYRWIYALPKGELARQGIVLQSKRTSRKRRRPIGERPSDYARIVGMVSIDARPDHVTDRRVPGWWEGDLVIGKGGKSAVATLVELTSRFVTILGLPDGKRSDAVADVLIDHLVGLPTMLRQGLTLDQGTELAGHAAVTLAADLPIYFAHPRSPWERPTNENTNGLIREYLPKGVEIPSHQPFLDTIADELNNRPRKALGFYTPKEVLERIIHDDLASTG